MEELSKGMAVWGPGKGEDRPGALSLLSQAHQGALRRGREDDSLVGSSTACVALVSPHTEGLVLDVANLGDSGLVVYRAGAAVFRSTPTHAEPTGYVPQQLAVIPARYKAGGAVESDVARDSAEAHYILQKGDWLVMGSDGLLDNLNMDSLGPALQEYPDPAGPAAAEIVAAALGGPKVDDITVIAMFVERCGPSGEAGVPLPSRL
jgi:serine/threonine protein phosphatase PrpC